VTDLRYAWVECCACHATWVCMPTKDYFHLAGLPPSDWTPSNGYCWNCFLVRTGMPPRSEPPYSPRPL
jgi:hypothetical protein